MNLGDTKQAISLGAVAVAALGFVGYQFLGRGAAVAPALPTAHRPPPTANPVPTSLYVDPFSHPALAFKSTETEPPTPGTRQPPTANRKPPSVNSYSTAERGDSSTPSIEPLPPMLPGSLTKNQSETSQQSKPKAPRKIMVAAIIKAKVTVAYIEVDGGQARPYHVGECPLGLGRITAITDAAVVLVDKKGKRTLTVGKELEL